ncbi:hypothetical protein L195_g061176, partial [Trifolium pratense]
GTAAVVILQVNRESLPIHSKLVLLAFQFGMLFVIIPHYVVAILPNCPK